MFTENEKFASKQWFQTIKQISGARNASMQTTPRREFVRQNPYPISEKLIQKYEEGYGIKRLAQALDMTPMVMRKLLTDYCGHTIRRGTNVVTAPLREIRRANVTGEKSPWYDWPRRRPEMLSHHPLTGLQGYYTRPDGSRVWLRSTWEYIYAKWLDRHNICWGFEDLQFKLSTGESYRPDFFIYDDRQKLDHIVEIKNSYYTINRKDKFERFAIEYPTIKAVIIEDINQYRDKSYAREIEEWKRHRS